jgi:hypothetical protein
MSRGHRVSCAFGRYCNQERDASKGRVTGGRIRVRV